MTHRGISRSINAAAIVYRRFQECHEEARRHQTPALEAEAQTWLELAAKVGAPEAQMLLGCRYSEGAGVEQNDEAAIEWWLKAAEAGHAEAIYKLGEAIEDGRISSIPPSLADSHYVYAAHLGSTSAKAALGRRRSMAEGRDVRHLPVEKVEARPFAAAIPAEKLSNTIRPVHGCCPCLPERLALCLPSFS